MAENTRKKKGAAKEAAREDQFTAESDASTDDFNRRFNRLEVLIADLKKSLDAKYSEIDVRLNDLQKSQSFICEQYENFRKVTNSLMADNTKLRNENEKLKAEVNILQRSVDQAHDDINSLEQYGRRSMFEISGIPRCDDEDVEAMVLSLCHKIGVQITPVDIEAAHRLSNKVTANIIVLMKSRKLRNDIFQRRSQLKGVSSHDIGVTSRPPNKLFINESLTRKNKELFSKVNDFKKVNGYKFIWSRNGIIYLRQSESSKAIMVKKEADLPKLSSS